MVEPTAISASGRRYPKLWVWCVASLLIGIGISFIPWGDPSGYHGIGYPAFIVAWQRTPPTNELLDFPNPLAIIFNPAFVFLTGILIWLLFRVAIFLYHRISASAGKKRGSASPSAAPGPRRR
jgi:hypothetical protein